MGRVGVGGYDMVGWEMEIGEGGGEDDMEGVGKGELEGVGGKDLGVGEFGGNGGVEVVGRGIVEGVSGLWVWGREGEEEGED